MAACRVRVGLMGTEAKTSLAVCRAYGAHVGRFDLRKSANGQAWPITCDEEIDGDMLHLDLVEVLLDGPQHSPREPRSGDACEGFVVVYDAQNRLTFLELPHLVSYIHRIRDCSKCPIVLVGHNALMSKEKAVSIEEAEAVAARWPNCVHLEASAKHGHNVGAVFTDVTRMILQHRPMHPLVWMGDRESQILKPKEIAAIIDMLMNKEEPTRELREVLKHQRKLDLSGQQLTTVPPWVEYFSGLEKLDLSDNDLDDLPSFLGSFDKLKKLKVKNNPLTTIPEELKNGKLPVLLQYLSELGREGVRPWRRVKLLVVGKENVGKTTLLKTLNGYSKKRGLRTSWLQSKSKTQTQPHLSTDGIDLSELSSRTLQSCVNQLDSKQTLIPGILHRRRSSTVGSEDSVDDSPPIQRYYDILFNVFDFGGQEVFYPTHQFFITPRSIYVVVYNLDKAVQYDNGEDRVEYWVKLIRACTMGVETPIIIVGTHLDSPSVDRSSLPEAARRLQRLDANVRQVIFVSCTSGEGFHELSSALLQLGQHSTLAQTMVPISYHRFSQALTSLRKGLLPEVFQGSGDEIKRYLTWQQVRQLAQACDIGGDGLNAMVQFFHDAGLLVHYDEAFEELSKLVVIDPQWLAHVMRRVISFSSSWVKNGIISEVDLHLWAWASFPSYLHPSLQRLLERFQIAYSLRREDSLKGTQRIGSSTDKRYLLIPSLLPMQCRSEVTREWVVLLDRVLQRRGKGEVYGRRYVATFLPVGHFSRLMVRILHLRSFRLVLGWREGYLVESSDEAWYHRVLFTISGGTIKFIMLALPIEKPGVKDDATTDKKRRERSAALLEVIAYSINTLFLPHYEITKWVMCTGCYHGTNVEPQWIRYSDVVRSLMRDDASAATVVCPRHSGSISTALLAPDIVFGVIRTIPANELTMQEKIGEGGYGAVLKALWKGSPVAVKHLRLKDNSYMAEEDAARVIVEQFDQFKQEAFLMSCLGHQNVVKLYGVMNEPHRSMVMELAPLGDLKRLLQVHRRAKLVEEPPPEVRQQAGLKPGDSLLLLDIDEEDLQEDCIEVTTKWGLKCYLATSSLSMGAAPLTNEQLPWKLRWRIMADVARGMQFLHSFVPPIVHRDLRSPNVFMISIDPNASVVAKVGDFGLARLVDPKLRETLGTWPWLAPEMLDVNRGEYDERLDIYSFGIVMWEVASRRTPFVDEYWDRFQRNGFFQDKDCVRAIIEQDLRPTPPRNCMPAFAALMRRCWHPNPKLRPSFSEIVEIIDQRLQSS